MTSRTVVVMVVTWSSLLLVSAAFRNFLGHLLVTKVAETLFEMNCGRLTMVVRNGRPRLTFLILKELSVMCTVLTVRDWLGF